MHSSMHSIQKSIGCIRTCSVGFVIHDKHARVCTVHYKLINIDKVGNSVFPCGLVPTPYHLQGGRGSGEFGPFPWFELAGSVGTRRHSCTETNLGSD